MPSLAELARTRFGGMFQGLQPTPATAPPAPTQVPTPSVGAYQPQMSTPEAPGGTSTGLQPASGGLYAAQDGMMTAGTGLGGIATTPPPPAALGAANDPYTGTSSAFTPAFDAAGNLQNHGDALPTGTTNGNTGIVPPPAAGHGGFGGGNAMGDIMSKVKEMLSGMSNGGGIGNAMGNMNKGIVNGIVDSQYARQQQPSADGPNGPYDTEGGGRYGRIAAANGINPADHQYAPGTTRTQMLQAGQQRMQQATAAATQAWNNGDYSNPNNVDMSQLQGQAKQAYISNQTNELKANISHYEQMLSSGDYQDPGNQRAIAQLVADNKKALADFNARAGVFGPD